MKTLSALAACAMGLASCGTMSPLAMERAGTLDQATLKEVNRHLELCKRTYTLGWPPSGFIECNPPAPPPAPDYTAAMQKAIDAALAKALEAYTAPTTK